MYARRTWARSAILVVMSLVLGAPAAGSQTTRDLSLDLNVPAFRLDVFERDVLRETYTVAVGMPKHRTPRGEYVITSIEWNPWWIPPKSEWARKERVTPPGAANPMGFVKLDFAPLYFLHGTPWVSSLGSAASHGCVRMRNVDAWRLARMVYHAADPAASDSAIDDWVRDTMTTTHVDLAPLVALRIRYDVVEVRGDSLLTHLDVYHLVGGVSVSLTMQALARAGVDTSLVDSASVVRLVRRARRAPQRVPIGSLLAPAADIPPGSSASAAIPQFISLPHQRNPYRETRTDASENPDARDRCSPILWK